jgi:glucose-1-phosphatase
MIRMVIFDLGGVFVRVNTERTVRRLRTRCAESTEDEIVNILFRSEIADAYERGIIDSSEFIESVRRRIPIDISDEDFRDAWQEIFTLTRPMADLLPEFSRRWRLGMISNTNAMHIERIRMDYDLFRFFSPRVFSHEVGLLKPDESIYRVAIEKAGIPAEECVLVDDMPGNVETAVRVGMKGFVFRDRDSLLEAFRFAGMI